MKNDEFNNVQVTNEGKPGNFEFTKAQPSEYSFHPDNVDPNKDELNNRKTINDSVDENVLKHSKDEEKKKQEKTEKVTEAATKATATSASAGSVFATVATASVVAIGAVVGIDILQDNTKGPELVTFLTSEIGTNDVNFSFSMPLSLLRYDEPAQSDTPTAESYKEVIAVVTNSSGYKEINYIPEYSEVDEYTGVFYGYLSGLSPDTTYTLLLEIQETIYNIEAEEPTYNYVDLAYRTFTTLPATQIVTFVDVVPSSSGVSFIIKAKASDLGVEPVEPIELYNVAVDITADGYYDEIWLEEFSLGDDGYIFGYGSFSGLTAETTYTLTIYQSLESEFRNIGFTSFTTTARQQSGFDFQRCQAGENEVSFMFSVLAEYIVYEEGSNPSVYACVTSSDQAFSTGPLPVGTWSTYGEYALGSGTINDLEAETDYILSIFYEHDNEEEILGSTTFTTTEYTTGFSFSTIYPDVETIQFGFLIKSSLVDLSGDTSNISAKIEEGLEKLEVINISEFRSSGEENKLFASASFEQLEPNTTYTITVYDEYTDVTYGSTEVTTNRSSDPKFTYANIEPSATGVEFDFYVSASYTHYDENPTTAQNNILGEITDGSNTFSVTVSTLSPFRGDLLIGHCAVSGLTSGVEYSISMNFTYEGVTSPLTIIDQRFTTLYSRFNSITSDYLLYVDNSTNNDMYMPIKLDFVNDTNAYDDGFIMTIVTGINDVTYTATLDCTTDYQYAHFTGQYFSRYSGDSFDVTLTTNDGLATVLKTDTVRISEAVDNKFYACTFPQQQFDESNLIMTYDAIYVIPDTNLSMKMVFREGNDEYVFTMSASSVPSSLNYIMLNAPYSAPAGTSFNSYADIKNNLSGTYDVSIVYFANSSSMETELLIAEGFIFDFA